MEQKILGLHHITAIATDAQRNYDFYTKVLGLRLVKKTVNFDDPGTYHFYYGDAVGSPGSILTFFPWEGIRKGHVGTGIASEIGYAVPKGSLPFWADRLGTQKVKQGKIGERFGEQYLPLEDSDGLLLQLVEAAEQDKRAPWTTDGLDANVAIKGFHGVVLTVRNLAPTAKVLTDVLGYRLLQQEGNRFRFITDAIATANIVDVMEEPTGHGAVNAGGTNHHIAFRVPNEEVLMAFREKVLQAGLHITEKIDRNYFYSLYFREPGGILFEIATDNPGFVTDETFEELGKNLMLPVQYEGKRKQIEAVLPVLR
ncbi:ring-cleaving dioxygenase [Paracnuella aquatica]|uniref:ring-cleaving dioxygenase n=1 Tax=Paracnuella aquatica TaxID=2268757 RepID=UPI000DEF60E4|nr:ring-cleaving dioxygenase [Paracnuella aquatica]RPD47337.1 ring-cleaving dioxygenase [Paracnuella aquatica]